MRTFCLISGCVLGLLAFEGPAAAQTMVEYGAAAGAAATAASGAKGVGSSIGGMFEGLNKTLNEAHDPASKSEPVTKTHRTTTAPDKSKPEAAKYGPAAPKPSYEDPTGIEKGMSCEEVTRRFGPPSMAFATEDDGKTMSYAGKSGGVQVECQGGKVASVEKPH